MPQLSGAKGDARRFGEALTGMKGSIYAAMQIDPFLEATDPRNAPPTRIREVAATAEAGHREIERV